MSLINQHCAICDYTSSEGSLLTNTGPTSRITVHYRKRFREVLCTHCYESCKITVSTYAPAIKASVSEVHEQ